MCHFYIFIFWESPLVNLIVKEHWLKSDLLLGLIYFIVGSTFFELLVFIYLYVHMYILYIHIYMFADHISVKYIYMANIYIYMW